MRKKYLTLIQILLLCLMALTGCGSRKDMENPQKGQYFAVSYEEEAIPEPEGKGPFWRLLGRQFYQDEAVQLWAVSAGSQLDIYLYHTDGSGELLMESAPQEYNQNWYLDSAGERYIFGKGLLVKLDSENQELFRQTQEDIADICQLQDGRIMLLTQEEDYSLRLSELDSKTGVVSRLEHSSLEKGSIQYIGAGENGLLLLDSGGIWEINLKDGGRKSLLPFLGTYSPGGLVSDFLYLGDGMAQVLLKDGTLHRLRLYDISDYREVVVIRDTFFDNTITKYIDKFNSQSDNYYIVMDARDKTEDLDAFREHTTIKLAAGKGADIICPDAITNIWELAENGTLEDLAPYMERDGVREEDYFPIAFDCWRLGDSIYGVNLYTGMYEFWIDQGLLGNSGAMDIESLIEALRSYEGEAVFREYASPDWLLGYFLGNTESLWGMVDWEKNTCDFGCELFAGILEVVKRYNDDEKKEVPSLGKILFSDECNYYNYDYCTRLAAAEGRVSVGYLSDHGNHAQADMNGVMGISSASTHKEGAWEFIRFMLSQEVQETICSPGIRHIPVNKAAYDECGKRVIAEGCIIERDGTVYFEGGNNNTGQLLSELGREGYRELFDPTEETVAEIKSAMEEAMPLTLLPTTKILSIISEEAGAYFSGDKGLEETIPIIQNRVQLYLDEHQK